MKHTEKYIMAIAVIMSLTDTTPTQAGNNIYLKEGEGTLGAGAGTESSPYLNIRTALDNIKDGDTLIFVGNVVYTHYKTASDGSAAPLLIDKAITITGDTETSGLNMRAPLQLAADITMKSFHLQMVTETSLTAGGTESAALGTKVPFTPTIYLAGHSLHIDNVNTKLGTSTDQDDERPYVMAGRHLGSGTMGNEARLTVSNANDETRLSAIYGGAIHEDVTVPMTIDLDCRLVERKIYAGGANNHTLTADMKVTLRDKANVTSFDRTNFDGELYVTIPENSSNATTSTDGIDHLTIGNNARYNVPTGANVGLQSLRMGGNSVLDLGSAATGPTVNNYYGGTNSHLLLNTTDKMHISGTATGQTTINGALLSKPVAQGQTYIEIAGTESEATFSLGENNPNMLLVRTEENGLTLWTAAVRADDTLAGMAFAEIPDIIVNPTWADTYYIKIIFTNKNGNEYTPDNYDNYLIKFERTDGVTLTENDIIYDWDTETPGQIWFYFDNIENINPSTLTVTVGHTSGLSITHVITVTDKEALGTKEPSGNKFAVITSGRTITVAGAEGKVQLYDTTGTKHAETDAADGTLHATGLHSGIYIITDGTNTKKIKL